MFCLVKQWKTSEILNGHKNKAFMSQKIYDNNLVAIHKCKITLKPNKPAYVEMCVLDLSKVLMYEFHYDYIENKNGNNQCYYWLILIVWLPRVVN